MVSYKLNKLKFINSLKKNLSAYLAALLLGNQVKIYNSENHKTSQSVKFIIIHVFSWECSAGL